MARMAEKNDQSKTKIGAGSSSKHRPPYSRSCVRSDRLMGRCRRENVPPLPVQPLLLRAEPGLLAALFKEGEDDLLHSVPTLV
jgi:hypothetical protein